MDPIADLFVDVCEITCSPGDLLPSCYRARESVAEVLLSALIYWSR
jgi:hypothetical protein